MFEVVSLVDHIEEIPVIATGTRWPTLREGRASDEHFLRFPQCKDDPLRKDYGNVRTFPEPFARGGGFFPVLLLMSDGKLCCASRTGSCHAGSGGEISLSFSSDKGRTWADYQTVVRGDPERNLDLRNPAFGQAKNGHLVLAYGVMGEIDVKGRISTRDPFKSIEVIRSEDEGKTWSKPVSLAYPEKGLRLHPHGQMRQVSNGDLVFNARGYYTQETYDENPELPERISYLYWSFDNGKTWKESTLVKSSGSETGFLSLDDKHWIAYVRFNDQPNQFAHSFDGGKTWPLWEKTIPEAQNQGASPGSVVALPNGKVLITYGYRAYPFGVRAVVSHDGGNTFDINREYIISDTAYHSDCGYPSTVCFEDGTIVTTAYTLMDVAHKEWGTSCIAYRYSQSLFV